jgi:hypothetical protein
MNGAPKGIGCFLGKGSRPFAGTSHCSGIMSCMDPTKITPWTGLVANVATIFGIAIALRVYYKDRQKESRARELETYLNVSKLYEGYIFHCLEDATLATPEAGNGTDEQKRKQALHICILLNMLECAYFLYYGHGTVFLDRQWLPWNEYMKLWCTRPELIENWDLVLQFDTEFVGHMNKLRAEMLDKNSASAQERL